MSDILCIDGLMLTDFDYIDLGRVRVPSYTVPVTIKSLVFSDDPHRTRERIHHHEHHHAHGRHHHHHGDNHHHHHHDE
jgi:ethanolamine utilization protein EutA